MSESSQGLAKSAPNPQVIAPITHTTPESLAPQIPAWQGVPMDIYKYLDIDFFEASDKHLGELKDIYEYAKTKSSGRPGDVVQKLEELQVRLGYPPAGSTRLAQLSNWVRIQNNITDMRKQQKVLERGYRNY